MKGLIILLCFVALAVAKRGCGKNQKYVKCGTACPLTCENYNNPPEVCDLMCKRGCQCDEGYVLATKGGLCVNPESCPVRKEERCGRNQHYEDCGTACPLTCENLNNPPEICIQVCDPGCHCDKGFVKTKGGKCVRPEQCPKTRCGVHQHYETCGTSCPLTCENYSNKPQVCDDMCNQGCFCDNGYVKADNGKCVRPKMCPAKAGDLLIKTCLEEPDTGLCDANFPMWYYDAKTESCKKFVYGGCEGNGNKYETEEECLNYCKGIKIKHPDSTICNMPAHAGICHAYLVRLYYDKEAGECKQFIYGGCGGNKNRFKTIEECKRVCA